MEPNQALRRHRSWKWELKRSGKQASQTFLYKELYKVGQYILQKYRLRTQHIQKRKERIDPLKLYKLGSDAKKKKKKEVRGDGNVKQHKIRTRRIAFGGDRAAEEVVEDLCVWEDMREWEYSKSLRKTIAVFSF